MRSLFIVLLLTMLAACRFEQPIPASLDLGTQKLVGDWKAEDGMERVIISDLRYGRLRMLYQNGSQGMILDGHIIELGSQRFLQGQILAMLGPEKQPLPVPEARWIIWQFDLNDKAITVRAVNPMPFPGDTDRAIVASASKALKNTTNLGAARQWRWVGSDKPAKL